MRAERRPSNVGQVGCVLVHSGKERRQQNTGALVSDVINATPKTETRIAAEQKWYNLTGRLVSVKVEADGDITLVLQDADRKKAGSVGAEIPVGPTWCELRQTVFGWTTQSFPFSFKGSQRLEMREPHVITVTGKASLDVDHASADHSNRRTKPKKYAVWEIHPVMAVHVDQ